jgi:hypothetical protein
MHEGMIGQICGLKVMVSDFIPPDTIIVDRKTFEAIKNCNQNNEGNLKGTAQVNINHIFSKFTDYKT